MKAQLFIILSCFFLFVGAILPLVSESFGETAITQEKNDGLGDVVLDVQRGVLDWLLPDEANDFLGIIWSIMSLAFWYNPFIPNLIETIFVLPLKLTYIYLIIDATWV